MATLTIKNLPDELYERLKRSARSNRRSIAAEAETILDRALAEPPRSEEELLDYLRVLRESSPIYITEEDLRKAIDEGRA
jgi:antitoxin FitA